MVLSVVMGKQWVRQQIRQDEVQTVLDKGLAWVAKNRQKATTTAAIAGAVILIASLMTYRWRSTRAAAWERLGLAESLAYSGRPDAAVEQIKQLEVEQPSSEAAAFGALFLGDMQFQRQLYKEAGENYVKVVERGMPKSLHPVALSNLALSQEASGQPQPAAQTAQRFLDAYPDHFLAPQVHACLARTLQAQGQAEQAKAAYQKIMLQYPDTSWASWAQARLKGA